MGRRRRAGPAARCPRRRDVQGLFYVIDSYSSAEHHASFSRERHCSKFLRLFSISTAMFPILLQIISTCRGRECFLLGRVLGRSGHGGHGARPDLCAQKRFAQKLSAEQPRGLVCPVPTSQVLQRGLCLVKMTSHTCQNVFLLDGKQPFASEVRSRAFIDPSQVSPHLWQQDIMVNASTPTRQVTDHALDPIAPKRKDVPPIGVSGEGLVAPKASRPAWIVGRVVRIVNAEDSKVNSLKRESLLIRSRI